MAFITLNELKTVAYSYQIAEITEADDDIALNAINIAIAEVQGYLRPNNKKEFLDGRLVYDVVATFAATGNNRNALILQYTKIVALWHLLILCNVDMVYEQIKERYDRAIDYLKKVNKGDATIDLPLLTQTNTTNTTTKQPFNYGSRKKFTHD